MSDRPSPRLGRHLRRHGLAYVALGVAVSFSPLPSVAAELVTTADIANGAVTAPKLAPDSVNAAKVVNDSITTTDIKDGNVTAADLNANAKGARVFSYTLGPADLGTFAAIARQLPADSGSDFSASDWSVQLVRTSGNVYPVPGPGVNGSSTYRFYLAPGAGGGPILNVIRDSGPGEQYAEVRVFRTVPTSIAAVAPSSSVSRQRER